MKRLYIKDTLDFGCAAATEISRLAKARYVAFLWLAKA